MTHEQLKAELLGLAESIAAEAKWLRRAAKLWAENVTSETPDPDNGLGDEITAAGLLRDQRAAALRRLAEGSPPAWKAGLYDASIKLAGGADVSTALCHIAGQVEAGPEPPKAKTRGRKRGRPSDEKRDAEIDAYAAKHGNAKAAVKYGISTSAVRKSRNRHRQRRE